MEQQQGTKLEAKPATQKEPGFLTSEFWVNGGAGASALVVVDKALEAIAAQPGSAWPIAVATAAACLALAGMGFGYALMRTRRKESADVSEAAVQTAVVELDATAVEAMLQDGNAALARSFEAHRDQIRELLERGKPVGVPA